MLRQLSRWHLQELPLIVIPNLFRDLAFDLTQGRLFTALSGFSAFKRKAALMLATWNSQLATVLVRAAELASPKARLARRSLTGLRKQTGCSSLTLP